MGATPQIGKDADENKTFWRKPFIKNNKVNGRCFLKQKLNRMYCNKKGSAKQAGYILNKTYYVITVRNWK